ncbi:hypothetical protein ScPMuIL_006103 [Solemya velum]
MSCWGQDGRVLITDSGTLISFSSSLRPWTLPLSVTATGGTVTDTVTVDCEVDSYGDGYSNMTFTPLILTPSVTSGDMLVNVIQSGRPVAIRCWGVSPIQFTRETSITSDVFVAVTPSPVVSVCGFEVVVRDITENQTITVRLRARDERDVGFNWTGGLYLLPQKVAGIRYVLHSPIINEAAGYGRYTGKHVPHEAGYDAFMCGYVFVRLSHIVQFHGTRSSDILPCTFRQYQRKMARFNNRINVIRGTLFNIRLDGPDPVSERPPMLFVKRRGYTQKLDCDQLAHWFSPYGSVDIRLMDSSRALVATGNFRCAKDIMSAFKKHEVLYVAKYSALRHSPVVRRLLWAGAVFSGSLCVWVVMSSRKQN